MIRGGTSARIFADALRRTIATAHDVLDIGTPQRFAKELRPFEAWFAGKRYVAAGYEPRLTYGAYNCDGHQDIQRMTFADASFDAVLCIDVLEHIEDPPAAAREIVRVLRPGGRLLLRAPFLAHYHGKMAAAHSPAHETYPDYWRFTHQGLLRLFAPCAEASLVPLDGPLEVGLKQFYLTPLLGWRLVRRVVDLVDRPKVPRATTRHLLLAVR